MFLIFIEYRPNELETEEYVEKDAARAFPQTRSEPSLTYRIVKERIRREHMKNKFIDMY